MRLPGDAETDMCVAWARSKEARRIAMTTWAPSGQHRDAREGDDALLTSDPADQQFTPRHSDRSSVETRRNYEGEAPATIARLRAARSQQAGGGSSPHGASPRRESPMSSPSWDSRSCISPTPMNIESRSAMAARSQQAGGGSSQRGVSPRRESPMSSPSWENKSCISPTPMNIESRSAIIAAMAARSQQAGGARSQRGVSPRRESPMSSPSWDSKSCISPAPMNGKSSSAHHRHGHSPSRRQSGHQIPSLGEIGKREERHDE